MSFYKDIIILTLLMTNSCGFQPLYGDKLKNQDLNICMDENSITANNKITLSQFLGAMTEFISISHHKCDLTISGLIKEQSSPFIIRKDASIDRYIVSLSFDYTITTPTEQIKDSISLSETLKSSQNDFATYYGKRTTKNNLVRSLAEDFSFKLLLINKNENTK